MYAFDRQTDGRTPFSSQVRAGIPCKRGKKRVHYRDSTKKILGIAPFATKPSASLINTVLFCWLLIVINWFVMYICHAVGSYCHCSREAQPTERFYKSVRPCSQVHRYKTLYLWWLRSTIHRNNRPCRSFEDPQEVESETGAHTSSRRESPSSSSSPPITVCHSVCTEEISPQTLDQTQETKRVFKVVVWLGLQQQHSCPGPGMRVWVSVKFHVNASFFPNKINMQVSSSVKAICNWWRAQCFHMHSQRRPTISNFQEHLF